MIRLFVTSLTLIVATHAAAEAVPVKIVPGVGITRGGESYFVKGAAGDKHLDELVATGGNSIALGAAGFVHVHKDGKGRRGRSRAGRHRRGPTL